MKNNKKIKQLFVNWGESKKTLPSNAKNIKNEVLSSFVTKQNRQTRQPFGWLKFGFKFTAAGIAGLFLVLYTASYLLGPASIDSDLASYSVERPLSKGLAPASFDKTDTISAESLGIAYGSYTGLGSRGPTRLENIVTKFGGIKDRNPATDTREFLKVDYGMDIRTRQVQKKTSQIQTIVRGYGGRVDMVSANKEHGYVEFVLSKASLDKFKIELKDRLNLPERFIEESIRSINLLDKKQDIEKGVSIVSSSLSTLEQNRKIITDIYNRDSANAKNHINYAKQQVYILEQLKQKTTSTQKLNEISSNLFYWYSEKDRAQKILDKAEKDYDGGIKITNNQTKINKDKLGDLNTKDKDLIDNTNTVKGRVYLRWISMYQIISLYIPRLWIWAGLLVVGLIVLLRYGRNRSIPSW